jgi:muskelin
VQALTFLQRDVHAVVDHLSDEETETFRALQSHLFDKASPSQASPTDTSGDDFEMMTAGDASSDPSVSALKHSGRSYMPGIPELERDEQEGDTHPELTPTLFQQRTSIFESLLELINADAKQPSTDLINLVVPAKEL